MAQFATISLATLEAELKPLLRSCRPDNDFASIVTSYANLTGCIFTNKGIPPLVENTSKGKNLVLKTTGSIVLEETFSVSVAEGPGTIQIGSDLPGLRP